MKQLVFCDLDLCVGCNRCVRNCPNEMANVATLDADGKIKVDVAPDKCIACGACINVCQHGARSYLDNLDMFINDLRKGVKLTVMIAPAIRANMGDVGRLVAWLKSVGAYKVYDVSLGADLCIWGHVRYLQAHPNVKIITQPCPSIVNYITMYKPNLLSHLSPVHGPMLSAAVLIKKYEKIDAPIAAISPCIAKINEFESTGLIKYNITFEKLFKYIKEHGITLPDKPADFDHYRCGFGSVFSQPGGLKENLEFFLGKTLRIDRAEGPQTVYKLLDEYGEQPRGNLPDVFDVLNCAEGCNVGPAAGFNNNFFTTNRAMDKARDDAAEGRGYEYFNDLYKKYDERFNLDHFLRSYKPTPVFVQKITEAEMEKAYIQLNKTTDQQRKFDCSACGSDTCREMARKIALHVNIPENCMQSSREKTEAGHRALEKLNRANTENSSKLEKDIDLIKDAVEKIWVNLGTVNSSITGFSTVEQTINNIASMINMIAINASIEAARSGQAGKAFSVIAVEIQNLAKSAQETLKDSHIVVSSATSSVGEMTGFMKRILVMVSEAYENIQEINRVNQETADNPALEYASVQAL